MTAKTAENSYLTLCGEPTAQQPCQPPAKVRKISLEEIFGYDAPVENEVNDWEQLFMKHLISCDTLPIQMDSLAYWRGKQGVLSKAALQILAVPASSAPMERIFSHAGLILTAKWTRMKDDLLWVLVKAKYND